MCDLIDNEASLEAEIESNIYDENINHTVFVRLLLWSQYSHVSQR